MPEIKSAWVTSEYLQNKRSVISAHRPYQVIKHLHLVLQNKDASDLLNKNLSADKTRAKNWCDTKFQDMSCHGYQIYRQL